MFFARFSTSPWKIWLSETLGRSPDLQQLGLRLRLSFPRLQWINTVVLTVAGAAEQRAILRFLSSLLSGFRKSLTSRSYAVIYILTYKNRKVNLLFNVKTGGYAFCTTACFSLNLIVVATLDRADKGMLFHNFVQLRGRIFRVRL